jgi:uncharacterized protein (AIM24 family)
MILNTSANRVAMQNEKPGQISVNIVGSFDWTLEHKGDALLLGPASVYTHEGATRENLWRELYMLDRPASFGQRTREFLLTALRRFLTGEPIIQDKYTAQRDNAVLGISTNQIGGNVVPLDLRNDLSTDVLIARRSVYFGSQEGVMLRVHSPSGLARKIYGPGLFLQEFRTVEGYENRTVVFIQIDSEMRFKQLEENETFTMDVLNAHAWENSVSFSLIKFGSVTGRLIRGDIPYWIQFKGPGKLWYSTSSFPNGYIGWYFTPAHWVYTIREFITSLPRRIFGSK